MEDSMSESAAVALLWSRLDLGDLTRDRLEVAASCGNRVAAAALGWDPAEADEKADDKEVKLIDLLYVTAWTDRFLDWQRKGSLFGKEVAVAAALSSARLLLPFAANVEHAQAFSMCLASAEAWLACPCDAHSYASIRLRVTGLSLLEATEEKLAASEEAPEEFADLAKVYAADAVSAASAVLGVITCLCAHEIDELREGVRSALYPACDVLGYEKAREAVERAVARWALAPDTPIDETPGCAG
jgi:hypothetical protein